MAILAEDLDPGKLIKVVSSYQAPDGTVHASFPEAVKYSLVQMIVAHLRETGPTWAAGKTYSTLAQALVDDRELIEILGTLGVKYWNQVEMERAVKEVSAADTKSIMKELGGE